MAKIILFFRLKPKMATESQFKYTTNGVIYPSNTPITVGAKSGIIKPKRISIRKLAKPENFPEYLLYKSRFLAHYSHILNKLSASILEKMLADIDDIFFAWLNSCRARKERLDEQKKSQRFFRIAQAELNIAINGPGPLTQEFLMPLPDYLLLDDANLPEPNLDWMQHTIFTPVRPVIQNRRVHWGPIYSNFSIPTLDETLERIAQSQQEFAEILYP